MRKIAPIFTTMSVGLLSSYSFKPAGGRGRRCGALNRSAQAEFGGGLGQSAHSKPRPLSAGQLRRLRALTPKNDRPKTSVEINGGLNEMLPMHDEGEGHAFET